MRGDRGRPREMGEIEGQRERRPRETLVASNVCETDGHGHEHGPITSNVCETVDMDMDMGLVTSNVCEMKPVVRWSTPWVPRLMQPMQMAIPR